MADSNILLRLHNQKLPKLPLPQAKYLREYVLATIWAVEAAIQGIWVGLAQNIGGSTKDIVLKKSMTLQKSFLSDWDEAVSVSKKFLKKYGLKSPSSPISFGNKKIYNPETGRPLTEREWTKISQDIEQYLSKWFPDIQDEAVTRAFLLGKLKQQMESAGARPSTTNNLGYDELLGYPEKGEIPPDTIAHRMLSRQSREALEWSKTRAGEYLSIHDGTLKTKITNAVRSQVNAAIQDGISAQELTQRLFHVVPDDILGKNVTEDTIAAVNRDWRRIAITELSHTYNNGYLMAHMDELDEGEDVYLVFNGPNDNRKAEPDRRFLGTVVKLVKEPRQNDKATKDKYAKYYVWPGKSNIGRNQSNWWICIPMHPYCRDYWERIFPDREYYDDEVGEIAPKLAKSFSYLKETLAPHLRKYSWDA